MERIDCQFSGERASKRPIGGDERLQALVDLAVHPLLALLDGQRRDLDRGNLAGGDADRSDLLLARCYATRRSAEAAALVVPGTAAVVIVPIAPDLKRNDRQTDLRPDRGCPDAAVLVRYLEIRPGDPPSDAAS
jgi:hypothetical protein